MGTNESYDTLVCAFSNILIPLGFKKQLLMGIAVEQTSTKRGEKSRRGFSNFYLGLLNFPWLVIQQKQISPLKFTYFCGEILAPQAESINLKSDRYLEQVYSFRVS